MCLQYLQQTQLIFYAQNDNFICITFGDNDENYTRPTRKSIT